MKCTLFLSSLWLAIASLFNPVEKTYLTGTVKDAVGETLIGTSVAAYKDRTLIKATVTDIHGQYRLELEAGVYEIQFSYTGFATQRVTAVQVEAGKENKLDMVLATNAALDEVVVTNRKEIKSTTSGAPMGMAKTAAHGKAEDRERSKSMPASMSTPSPRKESASPKPEVAGKDKAKVEYDAPPPPPAPSGSGVDDIVMVDGVKKRAVIAFEPETYEEKVILIDVDGTIETPPAEPEGEPSEISDTRAEPAPRAGLLTAGEWNDLHNWSRHWVDLLTDGETEPYQKMYGFAPKNRYSVFLHNDDGLPIADAAVQLLDRAGKPVWEARTDNTGRAELWENLFGDAANTPLTLMTLVDGKNYEVKTPKTFAGGVNELKISRPCDAPKNVDIVWAVDATGSMGDEIEYLKTELLDVIGRAKSRNSELAFRMGTVFYRDQGDDYITKSSGLTPDIAQTVDFIKKQFAGGGGDYPEAVHSALEEAIFSQKWSPNAIARICFLVLDASPHQDPAVIASLQKSIREAARLGIRIVPIAASGIQKDTEFLMKFFGLATNGTYVFLTDHSGIGGKHLEPTTDEYKVEPLNDLLVRLITEYTSIQTCEGKSEIRFENDPQQQPGPVLQALYYPNPASDQFTIELPFAVQSVTIYNSEGQAVRKLEKPLAGANVVLVNDLPPGFYTIRIFNNGRMQSGKLMVMGT